MRKFFAIVLFVISGFAGLVCLVGVIQLVTIPGKVAHRDFAFAAGYLFGSVLFPGICGALAYFLYVKATRLFKEKVLPGDDLLNV